VCIPKERKKNKRLKKRKMWEFGRNRRRGERKGRWKKNERGQTRR
jgi:hypothetical protein